jgi:hypothetical protein
MPRFLSLNMAESPGAREILRAAEKREPSLRIKENNIRVQSSVKQNTTDIILARQRVTCIGSYLPHG